MQLLIFYILNLPHFSSFQVFCLHIKVNNNNLSTFQTDKIHENFQYLFNEIRGQFQKFSLKRFFSPTRAPAGPHKNVLYALTFMRGPSETNNDDKKKPKNKQKKKTNKQTTNVPRHPPPNITPSPSSGYGLTPKHRLQHYRTFSTLTLSTAISP